MNATRLRVIAGSLAMAWACWWIFFAVATSLPGGIGAAVVPGLIACVVLLGSVAVAWNWEPIGGTLLILEGLTIVGAYTTGFLHNNSPSTMAVVLIMAAMPPIVAGVLFHISWLRTRPSGVR